MVTALTHYIPKRLSNGRYVRLLRTACGEDIRYVKCGSMVYSLSETTCPSCLAVYARPPKPSRESLNLTDEERDALFS